MSRLEITGARLGDALGDLAGRVGLREDAAPLRAAVHRLAGRPLDLYASNQPWPSALGDAGLPFELSVKVGAGRTPVIGCTVDPTDYRLSVEQNLPIYAEECADVTTAPPSTFDTVLAPLSLDGIRHRHSPIMLGLRFAEGGASRESVYVRTDRWSAEQFAAAVPDVSRAVARDPSGVGDAAAPVVFGADYDGGRQVRWKTYHWLSADRRRLGQLVADVPDLMSCSLLIDRFIDNVNPSAGMATGFLQLSGDGSASQHKVFFFVGAWGWQDPARLGEVLALLTRDLGCDLAPLMRFRDVMASHAIPTRLSMIAVGGSVPDPSVSFYFVPTAPRAAV